MIDPIVELDLAEPVPPAKQEGLEATPGAPFRLFLPANSTANTEVNGSGRRP